MNKKTTLLDPEMICIHEGLIWAAAAILGAGCFSLGYMAGVWGWV